MKVLLTSDHNPDSINGVIVSVMNLKRELEKRGVEVKLLCLSSSLKSYVEGNIYYIASLPFNIYPDVRASVNQFDPLIDDLINWNPDIIHSQCEFFTYSFVQRIANKTKAPIVHTYHTMYQHYIRYVLPIGNWSKLVAPVMRQRLKTADLLIAPTQKVRDSLVEGKVVKHIRIIPTGIDLSKYDQKILPEERRQIIKSLGIPEDARIFGSVGRLAEEKNYSEVIKAFHALKDEYPKLHLVLTGDGSYRKELEKEVHDLGLETRVHFPGMIPSDEIYKYYQILEFFVSASISETQGLTYIEALANGLPVIARKDGAIDGVINHGINGFQYESQDEFCSYIKQVLDDDNLLDQLQKNAFSGRDEFGTELFGGRVYKLYKEVLNGIRVPQLEQEKLANKISHYIEIKSSSSDIGNFYYSIQTKLSRSHFETKRKKLQNSKTKKTNKKD